MRKSGKAHFFLTTLDICGRYRDGVSRGNAIPLSLTPFSLYLSLYIFLFLAAIEALSHTHMHPIPFRHFNSSPAAFSPCAIVARRSCKTPTQKNRVIEGQKKMDGGVSRDLHIANGINGPGMRLKRAREKGIYLLFFICTR